MRRLGALAVLVACAFVSVTVDHASARAPHASTTVAHASASRAARPAFAVGKTTIVFTDHSRLVRIPGEGLRPRTLVTVIRYPAQGAGVAETRNATPARSDGPFPLIVFAHGFAAVPALYTSLLDAWTRAGYVVAAPLFPLTNAGAPGGPNESDLVNQPRDISFLIGRILARSSAATGILSGLVQPQEVAVTGQSDGGSTALALVGNSAFADHRVRAALVLSGAEIPGVGTYDFPRPSPPILAVQGTADTSNAPASTYRWFALAPQPKFLLSLLGAGHLPPYTSEQPQLGIVERETIAFLDRYLKHIAGARERMWKVGSVPGVARLVRTIPARGGRA